MLACVCTQMAFEMLLLLQSISLSLFLQLSTHSFTFPNQERFLFLELLPVTQQNNVSLANVSHDKHHIEQVAT